MNMENSDDVIRQDILYPVLTSNFLHDTNDDLETNRHTIVHTVSLPHTGTIPIYPNKRALSASDSTGYRSLIKGNRDASTSGATERKHRTLKAKRSVTRQLSVDIGDEVEHAGTVQRCDKQKLSDSECPLPPGTITRQARRSTLRRTNSPAGGAQSQYEWVQNHGYDSFGTQNTRSSVRSTFSSKSDKSLIPNPYNGLNYKIHSALLCPGCMYFFFICCLPGIYYMERSDKEYASENHELARSLARRANIFFVAGFLMSLLTLAITIIVITIYTVNVVG